MSEILSAKLAFEHLKYLFNPESEEVWVLGLDTQLRLVFEEMIFRGTINQCPFYARDIFRTVIRKNCYGFVLAHNHPSRNLCPSQQDIFLTKKILKISKVLDFKVIDHIIFSDRDFYSFSISTTLFRSSRRPR